MRGRFGSALDAVRREVRPAVAELDRLRQRHPSRVPVASAAVASAVTVALGNGVVLAGRRWCEEEWATLLGVPAVGVAGAALLRLRGWSWADLGVRRFDVDPPVAVPRALVRGAVVLGAGSVAVGLAAGERVPALDVVRLLVGTALGEELVHRGVVLGVWAGTGVGRRWVVLANMVTFAAWHVAGAVDGGRLHWGQVVGPGVMALPLLWARLRFRSVLGPAAFHAGGNLTGFLPWFAGAETPCGPGS